MSDENIKLEKPSPPEILPDQAFVIEPVLDEYGNAIGWMSTIVELETETELVTEFDS